MELGGEGRGSTVELAGGDTQCVAASNTWAVDQLPGQSDLTCVICGAQLVGDPDDQPDWPTGPMCGNCYQAREMDNELWWSEDAASETEGA